MLITLKYWTDLFWGQGSRIEVNSKVPRGLQRLSACQTFFPALALTEFVLRLIKYHKCSWSAHYVCVSWGGHAHLSHRMTRIELRVGGGGGTLGIVLCFFTLWIGRLSPARVAACPFRRNPAQTRSCCGVFSLRLPFLLPFLALLPSWYCCRAAGGWVGGVRQNPALRSICFREPVSKKQTLRDQLQGRAGAGLGLGRWGEVRPL